MRTPFPAFRARAPWWGPDLQTLRNFLRRPRPPRAVHPTRRVVLPLADGSGDALAGTLQHPAADAGSPLVVLIHGLGGSEESAYMGVSARFWLERRHPVLRLNLRGAGASRPLCRQQYHAGRTADLRDALAGLDSELRGRGLLLVGYSLGGNMLLKFLAEHAAGLPVRGAVSVSAPIDLAAASRRFLELRNRVYHWHLLRSMKRESLADGAHVTTSERAAIASARSIYEFDDRFVAPRNGFRDAPDYYARNSARRFLPEVRVPTLLIHALDDPWIPACAYTSFPWRPDGPLVPLLAPGGGHVGFHDGDRSSAWHDRCAAAFLDPLSREDGAPVRRAG